MTGALDKLRKGPRLVRIEFADPPSPLEKDVYPGEPILGLVEGNGRIIGMKEVFEDGTTKDVLFDGEAFSLDRPFIKNNTMTLSFGKDVKTGLEEEKPVKLMEEVAPRVVTLEAELPLETRLSYEEEERHAADDKTVFSLMKGTHVERKGTTVSVYPQHAHPAQFVLHVGGKLAEADLEFIMEVIADFLRSRIQKS